MENREEIAKLAADYKNKQFTKYLKTRNHKSWLKIYNYH